MKSTKNKLLSSIATLCVCFAMLIGSTYAWFTDSASTGVNKIQAGNLDVEIVDENDNPVTNVEWVTPDDRPQADILWEPGATYKLKNFYVKNAGNLDLKYKVIISGINGDQKLNEVIDWTIMHNGTELYDSVNGSYNEFVLPANTKDSYPITVQGEMRDSASNEYQGLSIDGITITVLARQMNSESDSFNNNYDDSSEYDLTVWDGTTTEITENNGTYEVNTAAELAWIAKAVNNGTNTFSGKTVKLNKDINLANMTWTPIGTVVSYPSKTFAGTFDGQGHTISNMYAIDHTSNYASAGLFGSITGVVENVTISSATVISNHYAGGICGFSSANVGMRIENCKVEDSTITTIPELIGSSWDNGDKAGGIIGYCVIGDTVTGNSVENTTIKGYRDLGGIVGYSKAVSTVTNNTIGGNVKVVCDKSHNYKNYITQSEYSLGSIIGDTGESGEPDSSNTGNAIIQF